ncbi:hypothetical protein KR51_00006400 [Rubidibacter lacunae KORDI 51-2]|uniref:Uncharacterized protein n=1 Tax=Rubidibacter lacunae KORDI 51-2 TaxID=582515 RepID=U5DPX2_9CHRO|nr:hypothetical protein [Rubidibacter lacunae]ERN42649.1 hypothetical protein KR51_00006400 [Rubidibacter lacunae KORDI 51-2]
MVKQLIERNRAADELCPHAGNTWQRIEWIVGFSAGARGDNAWEGSTTEYHDGYLSGRCWIEKLMLPLAKAHHAPIVPVA